jgi:fused signal recognition particle receptor
MFKFLKKIATPFSKIGSRLGERIRSLFSKGVDEATYQELEKLFYEADLGVELSTELVEKVRTLRQTDDILQAIRKELLDILGPAPLPVVRNSSPHVILVVGVNGSGKTTSLAKLASLYKKQGLEVLIAACDTFRAASVEQLERWAHVTQAEIVKSAPNSDPSATLFNALDKAKAKNFDLALIDTAGRLQTKAELMQELSKMRRVCQKQIPDAPHETLLVLDATIGQNALDQAREFHRLTPLTGIILAKLDGSAKGGIAIAIQKEFKIPIRWVGTGEDASDLMPFDPISFVDALLNLS